MMPGIVALAAHMNRDDRASAASASGDPEAEVSARIVQGVDSRALASDALVRIVIPFRRGGGSLVLSVAVE